MPAYKDLYDLVKSIVEKEIRRVEDEFKKIRQEIEEEVEGATSPLYSLYQSDDTYYYLIDIPNLDISTLYVKIEKRNLKVRCKDKMNRDYILNIRLPEDIDENSLNITRAKWLLKIGIKRKIT
ncbi:MAG: Hsp20/alpha crystallin family protein [Saccharolobus sp.]